jgi:hypothetical protein
MTGEQIHSPLAADDRAQTIVTAAQIDRLDGEVDPNAQRQRQHLASAPSTAATYAGSQPSRKLTRTEPSSASTTATERSLLSRTGSTRGAGGMFCGRTFTLVEVVFQHRHRHAVLGRHLPRAPAPQSALPLPLPPRTPVFVLSSPSREHDRRATPSCEGVHSGTVTSSLRAMRSLIACAIMAIRNWKVTGSIGGTQVLTLLRHFPAGISAGIMPEFTAMNFWTQRGHDRSFGCLLDAGSSVPISVFAQD